MTHGAAPSLDDIHALAEQARAALPPPMRAAVADVALRVEDFASDAQLRDLGITDPFDLTGLYDGIPLTERASFDQPLSPDVIWLFRRPILDEWAERGGVNLAELVTHVMVHEMAHHFGWTDAAIAQIDRWWL